MLTLSCCSEVGAPIALSQALVAEVRRAGLGPELDAKATVFSDEQPMWTAVHECSHAAAGLAVGAKVGLIEHTLVEIDSDGLPLADRLLVHLTGPAGSMLAKRSIRCKFDDEWAPFIGRARRGASRCDECHAASDILEAHPDATDEQVIDMLREAEKRALDFLDDPIRFGLIMCAARELHTDGQMSGDRFAEILGD